MKTISEKAKLRNDKVFVHDSLVNTCLAYVLRLWKNDGRCPVTVSTSPQSYDIKISHPFTVYREDKSMINSSSVFIIQTCIHFMISSLFLKTSKICNKGAPKKIRTWTINLKDKHGLSVGWFFPWMMNNEQSRMGKQSLYSSSLNYMQHEPALV